VTAAAARPASPDDVHDVSKLLRAMAAEGRIDALIELVVRLLLEVRSKNSALELRLQKALRALYGRKSKKVSADQLALLLGELGAGDGAVASEGEGGDVEVPPPPTLPEAPKGRRGRAPLPAGLPRDERVVPVPEAERHCAACGAEKRGMGFVTSEVLEFVPGHFRILEERREKLACRACEGEVAVAPTDKVTDRGRPGPGLLAQLLVDKYQDAMPLYRQVQAFARLGVALPTSTLGTWNAFACDVLAPVADLVRSRVLASFVANVDDTGLRVLDRDHPSGVKKGHVWAFVAGGLVAYTYTADWSADGPAKWLSDFDGFVQGDGYAGYEAQLKGARGPVVAEARRLGCMMHLRSKFEETLRAGDLRAAVALGHVRALYEVERRAKERRLGPVERQALRDEHSRPALRELKTWVDELRPKVMPKTPLYEAVMYAFLQWDRIERCFSDGRFEIDTGAAERALRRVSVGRKNYLFAGSDQGAERIAVAYTVLASCHEAGVNPWAYVRDVIGKLQRGWPKARLEELLPTAWATRQDAEQREAQPVAAG
jgi:transposase